MWIQQRALVRYLPPEACVAAASALAMVTAALLEAVRPLRAAAPALAVERLVARLREQRPDLDAGAEQVGEALRALEAEESEAILFRSASPWRRMV